MSSSPPFYFGRSSVQFAISPPDGGKPITILKIQLVAPIKVFTSKFRLKTEFHCFLFYFIPSVFVYLLLF